MSCIKSEHDPIQLTSSIRSRLRENSIPITIADRDAILSAITQERNLMSGLEVQIFKLKQMVSDLESQLKVHQTTVAEFGDLLAPIRRIPQEILSHIMELSCLQNPELAIRAPLALSHVCSYWRSVAINGTPRMWREVVLREPMSSCVRLSTMERYGSLEAANADIVSLFQRVLTWSKRVPLRVTICIPRFDLLAAIIQHSDRWVYLHLDNTHSATSEPSSHARGGMVRYLQSLQAQAGVDRVKLPKIHSCTPLTSGPPVDMSLTWAQLKTLEFTDCPVQECIDALTMCPSIETCTITRMGGETISELTVPLELAQLNTFNYTSFSDPRPLFDSLILPNLQRLELFQPSHELQLQSLTSLLTRSSCSLEGLRISVGRCKASTIHTFLSLIPSLGEIYLTSRVELSLNIIFDSLVQSTELLPLLNLLDVYYSEYHHLCAPMLCNVIKSRAQFKGQGKLGNVRVTIGVGRAEDAKREYLAPLKALSEKKFSVEVYEDAWRTGDKKKVL